MAARRPPVTAVGAAAAPVYLAAPTEDWLAVFEVTVVDFDDVCEPAGSTVTVTGKRAY